MKRSEKAIRVSILGTVGVPASYGGFETLTENLVAYHERSGSRVELTVYCSKGSYEVHPTSYRNANLVYIGVGANGASSILYDVLSLWDAARRKQDVILLLGVSGAAAIPFLKLFSRARILTNLDGVEWRREKWSWLARAVLRASEWAAVRFSDTIIADNEAIAKYVGTRYGRDCVAIPYGGDHALVSDNSVRETALLPAEYALSLCRIEPENNVSMILEAWAKVSIPLVFIGNWSNSAYGRAIKRRFRSQSNIYLLDPIYEVERLSEIRRGARLYVHGHSAGGTNPSLVEIMHFGVAVVAYSCDFNRHTTEECARYFSNSGELAAIIEGLSESEVAGIGSAMLEIAQRRYTWERVGKSYFALFGGK